MADEYGDPCDHIQHHGLLTCPGLTPEEKERGERYRSVGFTFVGGKDVFHGDYGTIREQTSEIMANAKKYGNEPPEYMGPRSKGRAYSEMLAETPDARPKMSATEAATAAVTSAGL